MMKTLTTKIYFALIAGFLLANLKFAAAQQNSLAFDGTGDLVTTAGASSLIAGSNNISMTCWVYPSNPTPQSTSYDGFCGFRNNANADFYILHYTATTTEVRFRNSAGTVYDISGSGIVINTWQHLVLTYDGSMLRYYHNGVLQDSLPATGNITATSDDFYMGGLPYQTSIFNLFGKLDDVSLWNKTLSPSEINSIYLCGIDSNDTGLQLLYRFNQGIAGGNNTAITTATDAAGNIDGTLANFLMTGTASNFVTGYSQTATAVTAGICTGDSYTFGSQVLTTAGVYTDTLTSVNGCDSIVTLTLTVASVDTTVVLFGTVLHSNQNSASSYKWLNCNTGYSIIPGATSQNYAVTVAGNYAVVVTLNGCSDTSNCHSITFAGIQENNVADYIHFYPNPVADILTVDLDQQLNRADIQITDVEGRILWSQKENSNMHLKINVAQWSSGIYFMKVTSTNGTATFKLQKK